jgi:AraC-like DNA-binding protein
MKLVDDRLRDHLAAFPTGERQFFAHELELLPSRRNEIELASTFVQRDYAELVYFLEGEGSVRVIDSTGAIRVDSNHPGDLYLWRPQDRRCRWLQPGMQPIKLIQVGFPEAEWRAFAHLMGIDSAWLTQAGRVASAPGLDSEVRPAFERIVAVARSSASLFELARFWATVAPALLPGDGAASRWPAWLVSAVDAMYDEVNLRLGVPRFLAMSHVSRRQLSRAVHQHLGATPSSFVAGLRLRHAMKLLSTTSESVSRVAERCGYASPSHLGTAFRRGLGMAPTEYRSRALGALAPRGVAPRP